MRTGRGDLTIFGGGGLALCEDREGGSDHIWSGVD